MKRSTTPKGIKVTARTVEIRCDDPTHPLRAAVYAASLAGGPPLAFEGKRWRVESLVYDSATVWDPPPAKTGDMLGWNARLVEVLP